MVYKVRGQKQYLDRVGVFTVDCGEKEMVNPSDLSILPDSLGVEMFPPAATKVVVGGIMAMDMDRDWGVQASMYVSSMMEGQRDREEVCRGKVLLHMSDTVWLDRCQVMVRQPTWAKFVCTFETVSWLVNEGVATTIGKGKLVAAAASDGVYRRARLEEMVYKVRGQKQYLDRVGVFTVDCGEKEMVNPSDLSILPDSLGVEMFPPAATKVVVGGIMAMDMDRDWGVQASMYVSSMMEGQRDREEVCRGKVLLHMSDTVWLDRCQVMVRQPTWAKFVCTFETVSWLVNEGLATTNSSK